MEKKDRYHRILYDKIDLYRIGLYVSITVLIAHFLFIGCYAFPVSSIAPETLTPCCWETSIKSTPVQYADVNGIRLGYRELGSGEPLLLIQGYANTMDKWDPDFICILASEYRLFIYDNRGIGESTDNGATPSIKLYSDDAAAFISALGYSNMNIYGSSLGSSIAQQLVIDHPEKVSKLILDSNSYNFWVPECETALKMLQAEVNDTSLPRGVRNEAQALLTWNGSWDNLSGINKEVLLTVGTMDTFTPEELSLTMAEQMNGSWLIRYNNIPHFGSTFAPGDYAFGVLYFLGTGKNKSYIKDGKYYSLYNQ